MTGYCGEQNPTPDPSLRSERGTNGGVVSTVQRWGLQADIVAGPEVETWLAAALAGIFGAFCVTGRFGRVLTNPILLHHCVGVQSRPGCGTLAVESRRLCTAAVRARAPCHD